LKTGKARLNRVNVIQTHIEKLPCVEDWMQDVKRKDRRPCILYLLALNKIVFGLHITVNIEYSHSWVTVTPILFLALNFDQKLTKKKTACS